MTIKVRGRMMNDRMIQQKIERLEDEIAYLEDEMNNLDVTEEECDSLYYYKVDTVAEIKELQLKAKPRWKVWAIDKVARVKARWFYLRIRLGLESDLPF